MKKHGIGSRLLALLLVLAMVVPMVPMQAQAATKHEPEDVPTGLTGNIDTSDTISLPIKILDYENDGMLFEFAEASGVKTPLDFGGKFYQDMDTSGDIANTTADGGFDDVTVAEKSNSYAKWTRMTYKGGTSNNWTKGNSGIWISTYSHKDDDGNWIDRIGSDLTDINDIRYVTVVYRTNVTSDNIAFAFGDSADEADKSGRYTGQLAFTQAGATGDGSSTNWTYAVYDLQDGTLADNWGSSHPLISNNPARIYISLPLDATNEWIEMSYVAFFPNKGAAEAFGEYALTDGSDRGDNRAFGLLRGSRDQTGTIDVTGIDDVIGTGVQMLNTYGEGATVKDFSTVTGLGYKLLGTFGLKGIANIGLLESKLSAEGYPVYKEEVVDYMASLLQKALEVPERNSDGWKNYRYIKGTASSIYGGTDLATALRAKINKNMGTYDEASGKNLVGTWSQVSGNIKSYYDAAYFLLNSIFVPGSYNEEQGLYNYLVLSAGTDTESGDKVYVFDGGFTTDADPDKAQMAIDYNEDNHTIQNTSAAGKTHFYYSDSAKTTLNPFLPVTDDNTADGMTKSPYYQDDGVIQAAQKQEGMDSLYKRDFNFAMVSEGEFVYRADDELFFEFEGDDDVYLFINEELVMDIGSAHSIDSVRFNLNDYVNAAKAGTLGSDARNEALALEEGATYSFKFYYMERHSYGSNIRISTNIRVTDPSMVTTKTAWQDGAKLDFGSIVDKDKVVEYGFAITNNGEERLYNLTFTDNNIGVKLDPTNGLTVTGSRVYDVNGVQPLEASDLTAVVSHPEYADINVTFADNNALKKFLTDLTASGTESEGGLYQGATVLIRGIGYKLSEEQIKAGVFDNIVLTTATNKNENKTLQGQASMRVFVPADPMYYEWAGHDLKVNKTKLIDDVLAAAKQEGNILAGKVPNLNTTNVNKIELVTKAGTVITSPYVTIDSDYDLTINYDTTGSKVFYAKVTYNSSQNSVIIPVLVNVTDVKDSVYVLDYGLSVNLTDNNELLKNDAVTAPGRDTSYGILGIGNNGVYTPNEIDFNTEGDGVIERIDGTFTLNDQTLTYLPTSFMEALDTIQVAVNVYENSITPSNISGPLNINKEVEMFKNVTVLPATVVYYEDCFPAITYTNSETNTANANTFAKLRSQSNDQDENYGSDDYYDDDTDMSAGSLTTITIDSAETVATFTFKGTGFELIGRTNATDSATITVKVFDAEGNRIKTIPVITEFDNYDDEGDEEIYQVPVVRVKDLTLDTYTVQISGVPAGVYDDDGNRTGTKDTYLYVDGLRIYQPMGDTNDNYSADENGAKFIELRDKIVDGFVAVVEYSESEMTVGTGTSTWTENLKGEDETDKSYTYNEASSVDEYLLEGPNNEVYMTGTYDNAALVFYVQDNNGAATSSVQIALRGIDEAKFFAGIENATEETGVNAVIKYSNGIEFKDFVTVVGSTEQYYTIDLKNCKFEDGRYEIILYVEEGMVSYSSLKLVGLELVSVNGESTDLYYENGILVDNSNNPVEPANYVNFRSVGAVMATTLASAPETDETEPSEPEVTEPSEPEVTEPSEPEVTEPSEPEVTEPSEPEETEPSVPEETEPEVTEPSVPEDDDEDNDHGNGHGNGKDRTESLKKLLSWLKRWLRP